MAIPHRYALPCTPKTAHSTPSNCRIQDKKSRDKLAAFEI
jgi:hypothetical protein